MNIRTRFAPSPTGSLHMGGARTALFNQLLAKSKQGNIILRIEDTDSERSKKAFTQQLIDELSWLGLIFDEGPWLNEEKTKYGPYSQSLRYDVYKTYANQLLQENKAYYCFSTDEEIEQQRQQEKYPQAFQFQSPYQNTPLSEARKRIDNGENAVVRFRNKNPNTIFTFHDLVRGEIELPAKMVGDFIILRKDQSPVYNFCCAIDDALMNITHVLRGEEHLSNTLRQLMVQQALGFKPPQYGHLSLIMGIDGKKLSKRSGAKSVSDFIKEGYIPEGVINALALLGWSHPDGKEILNHQELEASFTLNRLNPAPPMFDEAKLRWINQQHLKTLSTQKLLTAIVPFLNDANIILDYDQDWMLQATEAFRQDWQTLTDAVASFLLFNKQPKAIEQEAAINCPWPHTLDCMQAWQKFLNDKKYDTLDHLPLDDHQNVLKMIGATFSIKGKMLFMPIRMAMIGQAQGVDLKTAVGLFSIQALRERAKVYTEAYRMLKQQ